MAVCPGTSAPDTGAYASDELAACPIDRGATADGFVARNRKTAGEFRASGAGAHVAVRLLLHSMFPLLALHAAG